MGAGSTTRMLAALGLCLLACSGDDDTGHHGGDGGPEAGAPPPSLDRVEPPVGLWVRGFEGVGQESVTAVSPRADGSFVVIGGYEGPGTFNPGQPDEELLAMPDAEHEDVVVHYQADGSLRSLTPDPLGTGRGRIVMREDGSYYVAGGGGAFSVGSVMTPSDTDVFVAKYAADGRVLWASAASGAAGMGAANALVTWADGGVAIAGSFEGTLEFGVGEANQTRLASTGEEIFLARYEADGALRWVKRAIAAPYLPAWKLAASPDGGMFFYGSLENTTTFSPGLGDETQLNGGNIGFVVKLDDEGSVVWARAFAQDTGMNGVSDLAPQADGGAVLTGSFDRILTLGQGERGQTVLAAIGSDFPGRTQFPDFFAARLDDAGELAWARREGGAVWDSGNRVIALGDGATLVAGAYTNTVTFAEGEPAEATLNTDSNDMTVFLAVYEADGSTRWVREGVPGEIAPLADGSLAIAGTFMGTLTLFAGEPAEKTLASAGELDAYVVRLGWQSAMR